MHGEATVPSRASILRSRHCSGDALAAAQRAPLTIEDHALYIYTSGTTGMPKAANINHYRVMLRLFGFAGVMGTRADPTASMICLPMYHTAGGLCATGSLLVAGGSVYIRERFPRANSGTTSSTTIAR